MGIYARPLAMLRWIKTHYPTMESAQGKCAEATLEMQKEFPHLTRHRGHVNGRPHWWLKDGDEIIDPTAHQFEGDLHYEEYTGSEPHGKCYDCGELLFRDHGDGSFRCFACTLAGPLVC